jgi:uncharacterized protein YdeI (YjbR/CyaY-like superfamily)
MPTQPVKLFRDQAAWEAWLSKNSEASPGVWLRLAKKASRIKAVTYAEALDSALCHGWIDGQRKPFDEDTWIQRFTRRGPASIWSKINRAKALALIEAGRMQPAGHAAIDKAKEKGKWETAYDSHRTSEPPEDFLTALDRNPKAKKFFPMLNRQNRYAILFRIQTATKPETRAKRIAQFVEMLAKGETIYPNSAPPTASAKRASRG